MASSPTYESYCRERKATLDKHRFAEHSRSMSEVVDDILEIISTDEEILQKSRRGASLLTTESSYATWSLSSSAIMTSWPSGSTLGDNDDEDDTVYKSIQSYTSPLFSPLYEVRPDQQNVFQENRQPLPKAGQTPKVRNLCYNLATDISYDEANDCIVHHEAPTAKKVSSTAPSSKTQRAHNATERILLSVSPLAAMTNTEIYARDTKVELDQTSTHPPQALSVHPDVETDEHNMITTPQDAYTTDEYASTQQSAEEAPLPYDDFYARKDWVLKSYSSADSGELSLEPLLNAYSEDFNAEEMLISDRRVFIHTEETSHVKINAVASEDVTPVSAVTDSELSRTVETKPSKHAVPQLPPLETMAIDVFQSESLQPSILNNEFESSDKMRAMSHVLTFQAFEKICIKQQACLHRISLDVPLTPSLLHAIDTSLMTLQSTIAKSIVDCSALVRHEKNRSSLEEQTFYPITPNDGPIVLGNQPTISENNGCFDLDLDAFCLQNGDGKHPNDNKCVFDCGSIPPDSHAPIAASENPVESLSTVQTTNGFETKTPIDSTMEEISVIHVPSETIDLTGTWESPVDVTEKFEYDTLPPLRSNRSGESNSDDIVHKFLRSIEGDDPMGFDFNNDDETAYSTSGPLPKSFDSEQFIRDMGDRLEAELSSIVGNDYQLDKMNTIEFQQLSMSIPSASCESNDGLDEEICALDMFGADLKNELEQANDKSVLATITSPIFSLLSPQSSSCSMTTAFLSDNNALSCMSSDGEFFPPPNVRKVHFNEQVEEFLYLAHEACGTPDAKETERQKVDETFMDEICNVFDEILDEFSTACVSISRAMDRTRYLPKSKSVRRSSVS